MILNEVKVNYTRQTGEDNPGKVREAYLVESVNCSDAEQKTIEEIKPYVYGDLETPQIRKRQFFDVFDNRSGDFFYEAKVEMITIDGDKESRKVVTILIKADDITDALRDLHYDYLKSYDCEIISIKKSQIVELIRRAE